MARFPFPTPCRNPAEWRSKLRDHPPESRHIHQAVPDRSFSREFQFPPAFKIPPRGVTRRCRKKVGGWRDDLAG
jgi:hypothetical protein